MLNREIGPYRLIRKLGSGGMGEVYLARHQLLGRDVAIKVIHPDRLGSPDAVERFRREATLLARLDHPALVRVFDLTEDDDHDCLVMEYVDGPTLRQRLAAGPLDLETALRYGRDVALGLAAAHRRGIIHRDLKSENVMIAEGDRVKLLDFGLAKHVDPEGTLPSLTRDGPVFGTLHALSPEQIASHGLDLDPRSDLFALGGLLYEMMAGEHPFRVGDPASAVYKICHERQRGLAECDPGIPRGVSDLVDELLKKNREQRPASAREVAARLAKLLESPVREPSRRRRGSPKLEPKVLVGVALLLILVGFGGWIAVRGPAAISQAATPATVEAPALAQRPSVVVTDFRNETGNPDLDWYGTAAADTLSHDLAAGRDLRVLDADWVARLQSESDEAPAPGLLRQMRVDYVLSGSYGPAAGESVELIVRLIDAESGDVSTSWSHVVDPERIDRMDTFGQLVRRQLGLAPLAPELELVLRDSLPRNLEAAKLYALGLELLRRLAGARAQQRLEEALRVDPEAARIWMALSEAHRLQGKVEPARAAVSKAVELSDSLPEKERRLTRALFHERHGEWDQAITILQEILEAEPDDVETGLRLSAAQIRARRPAEALATLDRLDAASQDPRRDLWRSSALYDLGRHRDQLAAARRAEELSRSLGSDGLRAEATIRQAVALQLVGEAEAAHALWPEAHRLALASGNEATAARSRELMAHGLYGGGRLEAAVNLYQLVRAQYRELADVQGVSRIAHTLGAIRSEQGRRTEALPLFEEALEGFEDLGDVRSIAFIHLELGSLALYRGELPLARELYGKALAVSSERGFQWLAAVSRTNLGELLYLRGQLEEAMELHLLAHAAKLEAGRPASAAYDTFRQGLIFAARGRFHAAETRLEEAIAARQAVGGATSAFELGLARVAWQKGDFTRASELAGRAAELLDAEDSHDDAAMARVVLSLCQLAMGETAEAAGTLVLAQEQAPADNLELQLTLVIARVRVAGAEALGLGSVRAALVELGEVAERAESAGLVLVAHEARLAAAELSFEHEGDRQALIDLERNAAGSGLGSIAQRAKRRLS